MLLLRCQLVDSIFICLGDIVGWDHSIYPEYNKIMAKTGIEYRNVIGNHDMTNWGRSYETSMKNYGDMYGPAWYSFNVGDVHYVMLNDNFYVGRDYFYIGYLDENNELVDRARKNLEEKTSIARTYEEFLDAAENKPGFIKAMWCGDSECEDKIKDETGGVKSRCIPFEEEHLADTCVCCGKPAKHMVFWGKQY